MSTIKILRKHVPVGMCFRYLGGSDAYAFDLPNSTELWFHGAHICAQDNAHRTVELLEHYSTHPEPTPLLVLSQDDLLVGDVIVACVERDGVIDVIPPNMGNVVACARAKNGNTVARRGDSIATSFNNERLVGYAISRGNQAALAKQLAQLNAPPPRTADDKTAAECLTRLERGMREGSTIYKDKDTAPDGPRLATGGGSTCLTSAQYALAREEWSRVLREKIAMSAVEDARKDAVASGWDPYGDGDS